MMERFKKHRKKQEESVLERQNTLQITRGEKTILLSSSDLSMPELIKLMEQIGLKYFNSLDSSDKESYYT